MNTDNDIIEIIDDIDEENSLQSNAQPQVDNLNVEQELNTQTEYIIEPENQTEEVVYDPINSTKEEIKIETESVEEKTKSGLTFVLVLFVLLAAFIVALPYISKLLS